MLAVIFEVLPAEGQKDTYLDLAAALRDELTKIDGFISIERFQVHACIEYSGSMSIACSRYFLDFLPLVNFDSW